MMLLSLEKRQIIIDKLKVMKVKFILLGLLLAGFTAFSQKDPAILKIENKEVKLSEFESIYKKNNNNPTVDRKDLEEYLELFINFKLKVHDAEKLGLDTTKAFIDELEGYRKQLTQPYLTDKDVSEELIKEAYERMKQEIRAGHILIKLSPDAPAKDTLEAYNELLKIRKRVKNGESFDAIGASLTETKNDKYIHDKDLGYYTAFYMVYPFENASYSTKEGDISMPVRTRFGYHIINVIDKRPARGEIKAAHIMIRTPEGSSKEEIEKAKEKLLEIRSKIDESSEENNFAALAQKFSNDKGSSFKGGELPPFGPGKMVQEFEDAAFALKNDGEVSEPIKTPYGWHLIKRINLKTLGTFEEMYNEIKIKVQRDTRSSKSKESFISKIKKEYDFKEIAKEKADFYKAVDNDLTEGAWSSSKASKLNQTIAKIGDKEINQQDFAKYMANKQTKSANKNLKSLVDKYYEDFIEEQVIAYEESKLSEKYPEYRMLLQEYRDGILLFELTDEKVWSKAIKDTVGLKDYYEANKSNYMWPERVEAIVYSCENEKIAKQVKKMVKKKAKKGYTKEDILKAINTDSQLYLTIEENTYSKGENEVIDMIEWNVGITDIVKRKDNRYAFAEINKKLAAQPKQISEARGLITSDYQNHLEKEWIKELKSKYKYEVKKDLLDLVK